MVAGSVSKEIDVSAIPLDRYVTVSPDGHLQCEGKRVRYWGFIGHFSIGWNKGPGDPQPSDAPEVRARKIDKLYPMMPKIGWNSIFISSVKYAHRGVSSAA